MPCIAGMKLAGRSARSANLAEGALLQVGLLP